MSTMLADILAPGGAIARRMGEKFEFRPQQLEMAAAVESALVEGHHLLVEAGTGVGKSFAYLLPAIDYAVKNHKRIVISTHTISLQEQLIDKDIPLIQAVYPDEFTAVLCKGRSNYLCQRRLSQTRQRQQVLFEADRQLESLWMIEEWANDTGDGSLATLPRVPEPDVWDKVCAEHGNCLGKRCDFYEHCFWQAAKRRMQGGTILIVNHALFFSDLALRMVGVNYLPKYDVAVLDEAHTVEDVAGEHFGVKVSESGVKYHLRSLYDPKRGKGLLSTHGSCANDAIADVVELHARSEQFFERCIRWQELNGRSSGRIHEAGIVENDLSPKLRDLSLHLKAMLPNLQADEEQAEIESAANKAGILAESVETVLAQKMEDTVYWMDVAGRTPKRVSLHAAPINVAEGLRRHLFEKMHSVVMTSATLCTGGAKPPQGGTGAPPVMGPSVASPMVTRGTGAPPVMGASVASPMVTCGTGAPPVSNPSAEPPAPLGVRQGAYLPHWSRQGAIYAITFRLFDSLPREVAEAWRGEREAIMQVARQANRPLSADELRRLRRLHSEKVDKVLNAGHGSCWLRHDGVAKLVADTLAKFNGVQHHLLAWCIMPNHVHVVLQPLPSFDLPRILHSLKSWTAKAANELLQREGEFWQAEYYDHLIRDDEDLAHCVEYAWSNPEEAGLKNWKWRGKADSLIRSFLYGAAIPKRGKDHGRGAHATRTPPPAPPHGTGAPPVASKHARGADAFAYIKSRLGVVRERTLALGSPFDYETQATLYIEEDLPEPNDTARFLPAACEKILKYLQQTNGGAFVLFTSYSMLRDAANQLNTALEQLGYPVLVQGQGAPRKVLLDRFRATAQRGPLRHLQLLAGHRRAGGPTAQRHHRETALRRAG